MGPLAVIALGALALLGGAIILRSFGPAYRIGRLLATAPHVSVEEAVALAAQDRPPYVAVAGRVDSDQDFPDEHGRPLVFRRARLQVRRAGVWRTIQEERQAVPFMVRQGLVSIAVDGEALAEGLVTIPRESRGTAAEVPDRLPATLRPGTPTRLRIEQVSAVEHATVVGVPGPRPDGAVMTAGRGRPLVVSTVERDQAMRVLAGGGRLRPTAAAALLVGGLGLVAVGLAWGVAAGLGGS